MDYKYLAPAAVVLLVGALVVWAVWPKPPKDSSKLIALTEEVSAFQERTMTLERQVASMKRQISDLEDRGPRARPQAENKAPKAMAPVAAKTSVPDDKRAANPDDKPNDGRREDRRERREEARKEKVQSYVDNMASKLGFQEQETAALSKNIGDERKSIKALRRQLRSDGANPKEIFKAIAQLRSETDEQMASVLDQDQLVRYQKYRKSELKEIQQKFKRGEPANAMAEKRSGRHKKRNLRKERKR